MMGYIPMISYFLTNEMRLFIGLFLAAKVMDFFRKERYCFCLRLAVP